MQSTAQKIACYHCGEDCPPQPITGYGHDFCCAGCKMVYEILNENDLCTFYDLEEKPGISLKGRKKAEFAWMDDHEISDKLLDFSDENTARVTFYIPQIHCASCIWLLENLYKLNEGIQSSQVNFLKREVHFIYNPQLTSLRQLAELLDSIGYTPTISLSDINGNKNRKTDKRLYYQIGLAGFAFGNIMLISFPEYLGLSEVTQSTFQQFFGYLNIFLAVPVVLYCARDYLRSAWTGIKQRHLNIDVPISLGILTLFFRSVFEIITMQGAGYLDSLAGLVLFLLIGKWFQRKTYNHLSFERDYTSYFPIAVTTVTSEGEKSVPVGRLQKGDRLRIKNQELIPADGRLVSEQAEIDYSFVTGESEPVGKQQGEHIFAGGRNHGAQLELVVEKSVSQSYLVQLWNDEAFAKKPANTSMSKLADTTGKYFTWVILIIATATLLYWLQFDISIAINAFTSVLIIACPCAVALSIPFTFGNVLRILGKRGFYLKNTGVIEKFKKISTVVFDKTGTITDASKSALTYTGKALNAIEKQCIRILTQQSIHPVSKKITAFLNTEGISTKSVNKALQVADFEEITGRGIQGRIGDDHIKVGSSAFVHNGRSSVSSPEHIASTWVSINNTIAGYFTVNHQLRNGFQEMVNDWTSHYTLLLFTGDNERQKAMLQEFIPAKNLYFNQSPTDKLQRIKALQNKGKQILMLGDGLNDAGALQQSDIGIVISENSAHFTPASDAILQSDRFAELPQYIRFARASVFLIFGAYFLAAIYNVIGLSYAVRGDLSPVIAAILMPLSSITIVVYGVLSSAVLGRICMGRW